MRPCRSIEIDTFDFYFEQDFIFQETVLVFKIQPQWYHPFLSKKKN